MSGAPATPEAVIDKVSTDADGSPITNRWGDVEPLRPPVDHVVVHRADPAASYNHHPQITSHEGRLLATWSNGYRDEDQCGQRMMLATSEDGGETWSRPRPVVDRPPGRGVVTSMGIHPHGSGLTAYAGYYEITDHGLLGYYATGGNHGMSKLGKPYHALNHTRVLRSDDGGESWRQAAQIDRFVPNLAPQRLKSGRLILPGNLAFFFSDDPAGVEGWRFAALPRLPEGYSDDPEGFWRGCAVREDDTHYCEGSCFETDDGVVHMMLRSGGRTLAVAESRDAGVTWLEPVLTGFTDCHCRHHFGRLPDGRFIATSCPQPGSIRTPMVLAISRDGVVFDQHVMLGEEPFRFPRTPGMHKYGRYGYPSFHVMQDTLFVIYSISREDIGLARLRLDDLD